MFFFLIYSHLAEEEGADCFSVIVFLMSNGCKCCVSLLCSAVGWSTQYDCVVSYSYLILYTVHIWCIARHQISGCYNLHLPYYPMLDIQIEFFSCSLMKIQLSVCTAFSVH